MIVALYKALLPYRMKSACSFYRPQGFGLSARRSARVRQRIPHSIAKKDPREEQRALPWRDPWQSFAIGGNRTAKNLSLEYV